jgi:predicted Zn-dependent protease
MQDRVVAISPQKDSTLQMLVQAPPPNVGPRELLARLLATGAGGQGENVEINGLQAYTAVVRATKTPYGMGPARYTVIYYNNLAYIFAGATKASTGTPGADPLFTSSINTFRRLRQNEFELAQPYRIRVIRAGEGTRIADLAKTSPLEKYAAETLRLLNDLYPNKEPQPGQYLKIVQ